MRIAYDPEVDALYIEFLPLAPGTAETRDLADEICADHGPDGRLAGLEILDASAILGNDSSSPALTFEVSPSFALAQG
jgi:uncharacterized protein YuzE